jgi:hypothetical protein
MIFRTEPLEFEITAVRTDAARASSSAGRAAGSGS